VGTTTLSGKGYPLSDRFCLKSAQHARRACRSRGVSGELLPRPNFTLCKSKSTACRLSSKWPRRDQTSRFRHVS